MIKDPSSHQPTWMHRKGGRYVILHHGINEATMEPCVIYQSLKDRAIWVRSASEFFDGRFTLDPPPFNNLGLTPEEDKILSETINTEYQNDR